MAGICGNRTHLSGFKPPLPVLKTGGHTSDPSTPIIFSSWYYHSLLYMSISRIAYPPLVYVRFLSHCKQISITNPRFLLSILHIIFTVFSIYLFLIIAIQKYYRRRRKKCSMVVPERNRGAHLCATFTNSKSTDSTRKESGNTFTLCLEPIVSL